MATAKKSPAKKTAPGNDRLASLAARSKGALRPAKKAIAAPDSDDVLAAAAALIGTSGTPDEPAAAEDVAVVDTSTSVVEAEATQSVDGTPETLREAVTSHDMQPGASDPSLEGEATIDGQVVSPETPEPAIPETLDVAGVAMSQLDVGVIENPPEPEQEVAERADVSPSTPVEVEQRVESQIVDEDEIAVRQAHLVHLLTSPEFSLDTQHDRITKLTLDLPIALVTAINRWELMQIRATGKRLARERLIDRALAAALSDTDSALDEARALPAWLKHAESEQIGSRVRAETGTSLLILKQEIKTRREKGLFVRHVHTAALMNFLAEHGIEVPSENYS